MFLEILQTLIKVLMVFSILIIAFGLSFYILMSKVVFDTMSGSWILKSSNFKDNQWSIGKPFVILDNTDVADSNILYDAGWNGFCRHVRATVLHGSTEFSDSSIYFAM